MLLVHKPLSMSAPSPYLYNAHHRRHPSAPVVVPVLQPTRTPGLLSLSKPARKEHKGSPKPRPAAPAPPVAARSPKPIPAEAVPPLKPAPEIRGRQGKRSSQQRSNSQTAPSRRRQPSPDPFKAPPSAAAPPPNKRRAAPIPVPPKVPSSDISIISRSDPVLSHLPPARRKPQRMATLDSFPICDDVTEAGSRPTTPCPRPKPELRLSEPRTPTRRNRLPEPPLTAPVPSGATQSSFPFPITSTTPNSSPKRRPATAARRAKHLSEGVFMPVSFLQDTPVPRRSRSSERQDPDAPLDLDALPDGFFASSQFQNSPSPDELPPPAFT